MAIAREVLSERGFPATTIREIAERAGVNPALLHYYFGTKSGLHAAVIEQVYEQLRSKVRDLRPGTGSAREQLRELIRAYIRVIGGDPYVTRMLIQEMLLGGDESRDHFTRGVGELLSRHLLELIEKGMDSGEFRELAWPFPVARVAPHVLFFFLVAPFTAEATPGRRPSDEAIEAWGEEAARLIFYGICGEELD